MITPASLPRLGLAMALLFLLVGCQATPETSSHTAATASARATPPADSSASPSYPLDVCVVSGQKLGSMGSPIEVQVKGRTVLLCCSGCEASLRADPESYLAKLDEAAGTR